MSAPLLPKTNRLTRRSRRLRHGPRTPRRYETGESAPVTEPIEQTTPETVAASSDVVAGAPVGLHGDRSNPVAVGEIADIGDGWRLQILNVNADAAAVISANQFNDPPPAGSTFTLVTVALGYFGLEDPKTTFETTISTVGAWNVELVGSCGVVPQELSDFGDVFSGGVVQGNICFVTTPEERPACRYMEPVVSSVETRSLLMPASRRQRQFQ